MKLMTCHSFDDANYQKSIKASLSIRQESTNKLDEDQSPLLRKASVKVISIAISSWRSRMSICLNCCTACADGGGMHTCWIPSMLSDALCKASMQPSTAVEQKSQADVGLSGDSTQSAA